MRVVLVTLQLVFELNDIFRKIEIEQILIAQQRDTPSACVQEGLWEIM